MKYVVAIISALLLFVSCKSKKNSAPADDSVYYTCSMDPQVRENKPGKCPICKMELTPVKKSAGRHTDEIELSAQQVQLGNIGVDTVSNGAIGNQVLLNATLNFDQQRTSSVSARVAGRVERLYFKNPGDYVAKGAKLYDLYSEALNNAKQEYLLALEKQQTLNNPQIDFAQLVQAAKNKLLLWGMSEAQVSELAKSKSSASTTSFYSNEAGFITGLDIKEGDYVAEGGTVVRMADLSIIWAEAQLYSSQLSSIDIKGQAIVRFPALPGLSITGRVEFVNPEINPGSRINLVRISLPNNSHLLKPGMQAYVALESQQVSTLSLPVDAVLRDSHGALVWTETGTNIFKYKMVEPGLENNGRIEIKSGLAPGDRVVVSGAWLINSEYIFKKGSQPMAGMNMQ